MELELPQALSSGPMAAAEPVMYRHRSICLREIEPGLIGPGLVTCMAPPKVMYEMQTID